MVFLIMMFGIYIYNKSGLFVAKYLSRYHELQSAISIYNSLLTDAETRTDYGICDILGYVWRK
jgi:hypothetical protein